MQINSLLTQFFNPFQTGVHNSNLAPREVKEQEHRPSPPQELQRFNQSFYNSKSYQRDEAFSLELKTQDGDLVTVNFERNERAEETFGFKRNEEGHSHSYSLNESFKEQYSLSIEGHLDKDERAAIEELVSSLADVADTFFRR
ncbi:hypothetical protein [Piscirickettsia litoralis]|uniref:Uncharacterized protein n=1 Tax=Piscirickettsia litoralis TaxID=1891921 RepID=A0ABX3A5D4_9GAMM|nr:hypothetical protein [Piscirickettsia litoralis]ODN42635.1 hypothetical protein BGC07_06485 [Piscirickettsia litoralis]